MLRGWLLTKDLATAQSPDFETKRFVENAPIHSIDLRVVAPEQVDLIVHNGHSLYLNGKPEPLPDFVLPRAGSESSYRVIATIRHLEEYGVKAINSSFGVIAARDKLYSQQLLAVRAVPTPRTMLVKYPVDLELVERTLGFPVVMKTLDGTEGTGVTLCHTPYDLKEMFDFLTAARVPVNIILQEFINTSHGRDLRVFVVGRKAIAAMLRQSADNHFKANFSLGGIVCSHDLTPDLEQIALASVQALSLEVAGVDVLFDGDGYKICEVNSAPGFKGLEQCHPSLNVPHEIFKYVRIQLGLSAEGGHNLPQTVPLVEQVN